MRTSSIHVLLVLTGILAASNIASSPLSDGAEIFTVLALVVAALLARAAARNTVAVAR